MASRLQGRTHAAQVHPALDLAVFRQMADTSNDAFYLCDERGRFLYVNERASHFSGYSRAALMQAELAIRSTERRGTELRLTLPVGPQRALALPIAGTRSPDARRRRRAARSPRRLQIVEERSR